MPTYALFQAAKACAFQPYQLCAPAVNGASTTSYYNSTSLTGIYVNSTNTASYQIYMCLLPFALYPDRALSLEVAASALIAALALYIS